MKWLQPSISLVFTGVLSFAVVAPATDDTWTYKADIPTARTWVGGCVLDGKIYVIGGSRSDSSATSAVEMYDPHTWTKMPDMPSARCYHAVCTFKGKIYVFGGSSGVWSSAFKSVFLYDPQISAWTQKADMPYTIGTSGIAVVGDRIYLMGGTTNVSNPPISTVMAYDPATELWTRRADMPMAREGFSACVVDGKIYAIGGCKEDWQASAYRLVEVYDPSANTWTRKSDMPTERWSLDACVVDGRIHAIGGCSNGLQASTANEVYDPVTDSWSRKSPLQQKRLGHFIGLVGNKVYAIGGHYPNLNIVSKTEEYDTGLTVPPPDFNGDEIVNFLDFAMLAQHWRENESQFDICPPPNGDGIVAVEDLACFVEYWLKEVLPVGLVAYLKLDETHGEMANDSAGSYHGALHGEPNWLPLGGKVGGALAFDGIDDYLSTSFILNPKNGPLSVFAWVKGDTPGQVIISQTGGANWFSTDQATGWLKTELKDPGRSGSILVSQKVITDGDWHRVGLTWDGSNRILYVDDVEVAKDTQPSLASSSGGLYIGAANNRAADAFWSGLIDDVRIHSRAVHP